METKANPNPNGCLAKALPDEPFFVLLARDETAPETIRKWADLRAQLGIEGDRRQDAEQLAEALQTAEIMASWRAANEGRWRGESPDWVVWSNEHAAFWRPSRAGYTTFVSEAGRYTRHEAKAICEDAMPIGDNLPAEVMMLAPERCGG